MKKAAVRNGKRDKHRAGAAVSLSILWILFFILYIANSFEGAENRLYDILYQRVSPADTRIVIIGIDESSISRIGRWPWQRDIIADVIDILTEGGAAAVGIDVLYDTPGRDEREDTRLAEAIGRAGNVTIATQGLFRRRTAEAANGYISADEMITPIEEFINAGAKPGHVNSISDNDGTIRRAFLNISFTDEIYPSFAYSLVETYHNNSNRTAMQQDIPVDRANRYNIKFTGRAGWYHPVSFADVYEGAVPPAYFRDKIVLIGLYAQGIARDWHFTSIDGGHATYGIEIHANMVQQLLEGVFIRNISTVANIALFLLFTLLPAVLFYKIRPGPGLMMLVFTFTAYAGIVFYMVIAGIAAKIVYMPVFCVSAYIITLIRHYLRTRDDEIRIHSTFGKYMAPDVVKKILDEGEDGLKLGGRRMDVTVLFVDIRGFTTLSESMEPEKVVSILNDYLGLIVTCIHRHGGTLDKFIGDAAMAIWGAPFVTDNHAAGAVCAAADMKRDAAGLERRLLEEHNQGLSFGIGINSGEAVIGNIGTGNRMDYTAIGDTVNTAARLESNAKPGQILVSSSTAALLTGSGFDLHPLGRLKVKGKDEEIEIFEVV